MITDKWSTARSMARAVPRCRTGVHILGLAVPGTGPSTTVEGARAPTPGRIRRSRVFQLTALYHHPEDTAAFDKHYRETHAVLASKLPGLRKYTMSWPAPGPDG